MALQTKGKKMSDRDEIRSMVKKTMEDKGAHKMAGKVAKGMS